MNVPPYSKEQADLLHGLRERAGGPEFDAAWKALIEDIKDAMATGTAPSTPRAQQLANRWGELVARFTGGNPEVEQLLYAAAERFRTSQGERGEAAPDVVGFIREAAASS